MKTVVTYIANDGTEFNDEQACVDYECAVERHCKKINTAISTLREHCNTTICRDCFAYDNSSLKCGFGKKPPHEWTMKMK